MYREQLICACKLRVLYQCKNDYNLWPEIKLIRRPQDLRPPKLGGGYVFVIRHNQIFPLRTRPVDYSNPISGELFYNSIFTPPAAPPATSPLSKWNPLQRNYYFRFISSTLFFYNRRWAADFFTSYICSPTRMDEFLKNDKKRVRNGRKGWCNSTMDSEQLWEK